MATTWDIMTFTLTGTLGLGVLIGAKSVHQETDVGWNPPAEFDERESAPPLVKDWLSPGKLQQLANPELGSAPDDEPVRPVFHPPLER